MLNLNLARAQDGILLRPAESSPSLDQATTAADVKQLQISGCVKRSFYVISFPIVFCQIKAREMARGLATTASNVRSTLRQTISPTLT